MFYIILRNGNLETGSEATRDFDRFATLKDIQSFAKRQGKEVEDYQELLLSYIILSNGLIARGTKLSSNFDRFATQDEIATLLPTEQEEVKVETLAPETNEVLDLKKAINK